MYKYLLLLLIVSCNPERKIASLRAEFLRYGDSTEKYYQLLQRKVTSKNVNKWIEYGELSTRIENRIKRLAR